MLHFILRTIGLWALAGALVAAVIDGMKSIAASHLVLTSTGQFWAIVSPSTLASAQAWLHRLAPTLWQSVVVPALQTPLWGVLFIFGILFMLLGLRRRRDFVYAS
jgi:hypothetical protein